MSYATYGRVSSPGQRDKQTIEIQRRNFAKFCQTQSIAPAESYEDDSVSGTKAFIDRPGGRRLIEDAKAGKFKTLLICDWDRIGRDERESINTEFYLEEECGIKIQSITEPVEDNDEGRLSRGMKRVFAAWELRKIRKRTMNGMYEAAPQAARYLGGPCPFGYKVERKAEGKKEIRLYAVNHDPISGLDMSEANVVKQLFRRADMHQPTTKLAAWLERIGVPTVYERDRREAKGSRLAAPIWRASRVQAILTNPMYKGSHTYGGRKKRKSKFKSATSHEPVTREVPAIVSVELWERVQSALKANRRFAIRNCHRDYLLRTMMTCGCCGFNYVAHSSVNPSGNRSFFYRCNGKQNQRGTFGPDQRRCPAVHIDGQHTEDEVWGQIEALIRHPDTAVEALKQKVLEQSENTIQPQIVKLEAVLRRKLDAKVYLIKHAAESGLDLASLKRGMAELDQEEQAVRAHLEELKTTEKRSAQIRADLASVPKMLATIRERLDGPLPFTVRRKIVEMLVDSIRVETVAEQRAKLHICFRLIGNRATC